MNIAQQSEVVEQQVHRAHPDDTLVRELITVLNPHPAGLRRWSVMRAIRLQREKTSRDIPQKLEADIERAFRRLCANDNATSSDTDSLFYKPREKAGEVWASFPERTEAWLKARNL